MEIETNSTKEATKIAESRKKRKENRYILVETTQRKGVTASF